MMKHLKKWPHAVETRSEMTNRNPKAHTSPKIPRKSAGIFGTCGLAALVAVLTTACGGSGSSTADTSQPNCTSSIPTPTDQQLGAASSQSTPAAASLRLTAEEEASAETPPATETPTTPETPSTAETAPNPEATPTPQPSATPKPKTFGDLLKEEFQKECTGECAKAKETGKAPTQTEINTSVAAHEQRVKDNLADANTANEKAMSHSPCIPAAHKYQPTDATQETGVAGRSSPNEATSDGANPKLPTNDAVSNYGTDLKTKAGADTDARVNDLTSDTAVVRQTPDPADITQGTGSTVNGLNEAGCSGLTTGVLGLTEGTNQTYTGCTGTRTGNK